MTKGNESVCGTSRPDVNESAALANYAHEQGVDGVMIISPYYFPLDDEGVYRFYSAVAEKRQPIFLSITSGTYRLLGVTGGVSASGGSLSEYYRAERYDPRYITYVADYSDGKKRSRILRFMPVMTITSPMLYWRGNGCIGGLSNIVPEFFASWMAAFAQGDMAAVAAHQRKVDQLMAVYGVHSPFIPTFKKHYRCGALFSQTTAQRHSAA